MMAGYVSAAREALLSVTAFGPTGRQQRVNAVIDTGYNGFLTLPPATVAALGLVYHGPADAELGDGSMVLLRKYEAKVRWHDETREVLVLQADGGACIGMSLLYGSSMSLDIVEGGPVTIEPMSN